MTSLVMTALQWTEKRGSQGAGGVSLWGVSQTSPRPGEIVSLVGIDFFFFLLFQQMYIVCKDTHTPMILGAFGGYDERAKASTRPPTDATRHITGGQ